MIKQCLIFYIDGVGRFGEPYIYVRNQSLALPFVFENTVSITKFAILWRDKKLLIVMKSEIIKSVQDFFQFYSVGSNILNRCCSGCSRDEREIFYPSEILSDRPLDEFMPVFPRTDPNQNPVLVIFNDLYSADTIDYYSFIAWSGK